MRCKDQFNRKGLFGMQAVEYSAKNHRPLSLFDSRERLKKSKVLSLRNSVLNRIIIVICCVGLGYHTTIAYFMSKEKGDQYLCYSLNSFATFTSIISLFAYLSLDFALLIYQYRNAIDVYKIRLQAVLFYVTVLIVLGVELVFLYVPKLASYRTQSGHALNVFIFLYYAILVLWPLVEASKNLPFFSSNSLLVKVFSTTQFDCTRNSFRTFLESNQMSREWESFCRFAIADFTVENILFWEEYQSFLLVLEYFHSGRGDFEAVQIKFNQIMNEFIRVDSENQVNLPHELRRRMLQTTCSRTGDVDGLLVILDEVALYVYELIYANTYVRWRQSRKSRASLRPTYSSIDTRESAAAELQV